jgi:hypothetical protein
VFFSIFVRIEVSTVEVEDEEAENERSEVK